VVLTSRREAISSLFFCSITLAFGLHTYMGRGCGIHGGIATTDEPKRKLP